MHEGFDMEKTNGGREKRIVREERKKEGSKKERESMKKRERAGIGLRDHLTPTGAPSSTRKWRAAGRESESE